MAKKPWTTPTLTTLTKAIFDAKTKPPPKGA
jgi:hypothetical protein